MCFLPKMKSLAYLSVLRTSLVIPSYQHSLNFVLRDRGKRKTDISHLLEVANWDVNNDIASEAQ